MKTISSISEETNTTKMLMWFDVFPKLSEDIKIKTTFSGAVTVTVVTLLTILFCVEFYEYIRLDLQSDVGVDLTWREKLVINFDVTFPALACDNFGVDIVDSAGEQSLEVTQNIVKKHTSKGKEQDTFRLGCKANGILKVNKVRGEFHIAFGREAQSASGLGGGGHIHRFTPQELFTFNCSHVINRLSFGEDFPGVVQPLDGTKKVVTKGLGRYQYFIQVVPTIYKYQNGKQLVTNQYSVTEHTLLVDPTKGSFKQPGLYFKYELSPYTVTYTEYNKPFSHFLIRMCALIGGIYTVAGMISSSGWYFERYLKLKQ